MAGACKGVILRNNDAVQSFCVDLPGQGLKSGLTNVIKIVMTRGLILNSNKFLTQYLAIQLCLKDLIVVSGNAPQNPSDFNS